MTEPRSFREHLRKRQARPPHERPAPVEMLKTLRADLADAIEVGSALTRRGVPEESWPAETRALMDALILGAEALVEASRRTLQKAADAATKGATMLTPPAPPTAWQRLAALARAKMAASAHPMTFEAAVAAVIGEEPELAAQYQREYAAAFAAVLAEAEDPAPLSPTVRRTPIRPDAWGVPSGGAIVVPPGPDAWAQIDALAQARVKKAAGPLTIERARAAVMTEHPALYQQHRLEYDAGLTAPTAAPAPTLVNEPTTAWAEIERLAESRVSKTADPRGYAKARADVMAERPDLYAQHRAEFDAMTARARGNPAERA